MYGSTRSLAILYPLGKTDGNSLDFLRQPPPHVLLLFPIMGPFCFSFTDERYQIQNIGF